MKDTVDRLLKKIRNSEKLTDEDLKRILELIHRLGKPPCNKAS